MCIRDRSEEYDPVAGRLVGNFPQAFSHVSLVNSASKLAGEEKPTSSHVVLGLARRSIVRSVGARGDLHMRGVTAESMLHRLVDSASVNSPGSTARAIRSAVGSTKAVKRRGRPTTKPSAKRAGALTAKASLKSAAFVDPTAD